MNEDDQRRAWKYVQAWTLPPWEDTEVFAWERLIQKMTFAQFQAGMRQARLRPQDELGQRPSSSEFAVWIGEEVEDAPKPGASPPGFFDEMREKLKR